MEEVVKVLLERESLDKDEVVEIIKRVRIEREGGVYEPSVKQTSSKSAEENQETSGEFENPEIAG